MHIDVGTNRAELWADPAYMGLKSPRDRSAAYDDLVAEFFAACRDKYGDTVLMQASKRGTYIQTYIHTYRIAQPYGCRGLHLLVVCVCMWVV